MNMVFWKSQVCIAVYFPRLDIRLGWNSLEVYIVKIDNTAVETVIIYL